jgi:hypothetical protein
MMKYIQYPIIATILLILLYLGIQAQNEATQYEATTIAIIEKMNLEDQAAFQVKAFVEDYSFGYFENDDRIALEKLTQQQQLHQTKAQEATLFFVGVLVLMSLSYFLIPLRSFIFLGSSAALIALYFGITTPVLMMSIHTEIQYIGDVVLSFESKGVLGSIMKLIDNNNIIIGIVILLFSVLVPLIKTASLLYISLFIHNDFTHNIVTFFKFIGKWSMVDVFVVATLLVFMTTDNSDVSRGEIQMGLYFFLSYVIVSILMSLSSEKMLKAYKDTAI